MSLDLDFVRSNFPAFDAEHLGEDAGRHAENAGGSWPCRQVVNLLTGFYEDVKLQPGHPHPVGLEAARRMDRTRPALAGSLGVDVDEVHIGPSTTANTVVLADAFRQRLTTGDAVVVTQQDHEANSGPWRRLADHGVEVREWAVDPETGRLHTSGLEAVLDDAVAVVAMPWVSNVVGEFNPVGDWCRMARRAGAASIVDAVAGAPHGLPDVGALGADVLLFSSYKTFGPHQGVMTVRRELLDALPNQGHFFNADQPAKRLVPAGPDHAQVAALAGVVEYFEALDHHHAPDEGDRSPAAVRDRVNALLHEHEHDLTQRLLAGLADQGHRVIGPESAEDRAPTVAVRTSRPAAQVAADLGERGVWCAGSHFYAWRLCEAIGVPPEHGVLRFSLAHYTSLEDVDRLLTALADVVV